MLNSIQILSQSFFPQSFPFFKLYLAEKWIERLDCSNCLIALHFLRPANCRSFWKHSGFGLFDWYLPYPPLGTKSRSLESPGKRGVSEGCHRSCSPSPRAPHPSGVGAPGVAPTACIHGDQPQHPWAQGQGRRWLAAASGLWPRVGLPLNAISPEFLWFLQGLFRFPLPFFFFFPHASMVHLSEENTFDIGERQIHLSALWINPGISYSTIWSSVIKSPFFFSFFLLEG